MSKAIYRVEQEIAVREMGWEKVDGWWVNPAAKKKYLELSQVLMHEWRQAYARAGRSDHRREQLELTITCLAVVILALVGVAATLAFNYF